MDAIAAELVDHWFGDWREDAPTPDPCPELKRWWTKDDDHDAALRARFGAANAAAKQGTLDHWTGTATGSLALILLLDQISRNIHRGTPGMFEGDTQARDIVRRSIATGHDTELPLIHRQFLYMPLMHSESLPDHDGGMTLFSALVDEAVAMGSQRVANYENGLKFAGMHRDIVERFGRYPHRNEILGRQSTEAEQAFLSGPNSSF